MAAARESRGLVYLAGPAYTPEETHALEVIAEKLTHAGWEVYLPMVGGLEQHVLSPMAAPRGNHLLFFREVLEKAAFALEIFQVVERCDALVFNMNGRVPDEGAVFKTAVAFAAGKPLVLYKRDHRSKLHGNDNAMISGLSHDFSHVRKAKKIPAKLEKACEKARGFAGRPYTGDAVPPLLRQVVAQGRQVWEFLEQSRAPGGARDSSDFYEELASIMTTSTL